MIALPCFAEINLDNVLGNTWHVLVWGIHVSCVFQCFAMFSAKIHCTHGERKSFKSLAAQTG